MSKVLITGGAGFIGFHLATALAADGHAVDLLDDFSRGVGDAELKALLDRPSIRCLTVDLRDHDKVVALDDDYHHIYHLAAIIGVAHVMSRPYAVLADNVAMLANVIELARRQKHLTRLLFTSTSEVMVGSLQHLDLPVPTPESAVVALPDLAHPRTSYMLSKLYGEAMCLQSGLPVTIIRPHNFYGPRMGMSHVVPELLAKADALPVGGVLPVASVEHRRAFCYIDDAIMLMRALMDKPEGLGGVFNIGNQDQEISIGDLAQVLIDTVGKGLTIQAGEVHPGSPSRRCPDMTKTVAATGLVPTVSLQDGVARTYAWYKANIFDGKGLSAK